MRVVLDLHPGAGARHALSGIIDLNDLTLIRRLTADPPTLDDREAAPKRKRKRDYVGMVKRALAAGSPSGPVNITDDGVSRTPNTDDQPADVTVIETADELRKLI
jgi:hypothetical protein